MGAAAEMGYAGVAVDAEEFVRLIPVTFLVFQFSHSLSLSCFLDWSHL